MWLAMDETAALRESEVITNCDHLRAVHRGCEIRGKKNGSAEKGRSPRSAEAADLSAVLAFPRDGAFLAAGFTSAAERGRP